MSDLTPLITCTHLHTLIMTHAHVSELLPLLKCRHLRKLDLSYSYKPVNVAHLACLKTSLEELRCKQDWSQRVNIN